MPDLSLLQRVLIAVAAILAVAALGGLIRFDMHRTVASVPALRGGVDLHLAPASAMIDVDLPYRRVGHSSAAGGGTLRQHGGAGCYASRAARAEQASGKGAEVALGQASAE